VTATSAGPATLTIAVGCDFTFTTESAVPAVFLVRPRHDGDRKLGREQWSVDPQTWHHDYVDVYGNGCRRLTLPVGTTTVTYDAEVQTPEAADPIGHDAVQHAAEDLPDDVLMYTLPSRFCLSDVLGDRAWELFAGTAPGWERAQAISDFVHEHLAFAYGSSSPTYTSLDAYDNRTGVCRDYAHLGITFCRAMNIPARYAFGYLPDINVPPPESPQDFCAWYEVYLGDRWWTFDPRNNQRRQGRAVIARGRDALDVAMVTTFGSAILDSMVVRADEVKRGD
jgi:transglutaminase-like putative cysteine protease